MRKILLICFVPVYIFAVDTLSQVSTIDALLGGLYDGVITLKELQQQGNFGIGTYDGLDGEMVLLDGLFYQVKADGKVYQPQLSITTPFAAVVEFGTENEIEIDPGTDFHRFEQIIDETLPTFNIFYALRMEGKFSYIKTRSVPRQEKPYLPLAEIAATQPTFEYENIEGTIIGFRCPDYVKGMNVPGYHLHFISKDKKVGGHLLKFIVQKGRCGVDYIHYFSLQLPQTDDFYKIDLREDKSEELQKVEK